MSYSGTDLPQMDPGETRPVVFDFTTKLLSDETITSVVWGIASIGGVDAFAYSCLGTPTLSGAVASNKVSGLKAPIKYLIQAEATTNQANVYSLYTHVTCMNPV